MEEKEECTHYDWYNEPDGTIHCIICNKVLGKLER